MSFNTMNISRKNLKMKSALLAGVFAMGLAVTPATVWAQPETPQQGQQGGRRGPGGERGGRPGMSAEQMQQRRAENLRRTLIDNGFEDEGVQEAVIEFAATQERERFASQEKVRRLSQAVQNQSPDAEIAVLLAEVRADAAAAKNRRAAALAELAEELNLKENPRLDALLALAGLTDDGIGAFGGMGGRGQGARGGFGGRGEGGRGGPQRGGQRPPMPGA